MRRLFLGSLLLLACGCFCRTKPATFETPDPERPPAMNRALLGGEGPGLLVVRVDWIAGAEPERYALRALRKWLIRVTARPPEAVRVELGREVPREPGDGRGALARTVRANAVPPPEADAHFVYVLYWDRYLRYRGVYFPERSLDRRIPHETVVMFVDPIERQSMLWLTRRKVEAAVLVHEFGHGAGLVTAGAHGAGGHCTDPACRMYWGVDWASIRANAFGVLCRGVLDPGDFCARCESDLELGRTRADHSTKE